MTSGTVISVCIQHVTVLQIIVILSVAALLLGPIALPLIAEAQTSTRMGVEWKVLSMKDLDDSRGNKGNWWMIVEVVNPVGTNHYASGDFYQVRPYFAGKTFVEVLNTQGSDRLILRLALVNGEVGDRDLMDISSHLGGGINADDWSDTDLLLGLGSTPDGEPALPRSAYFEGMIDLNMLTISGDMYEKHGKTYTISGRSDESQSGEYDAELKIQLTPFIEN